MGRLVMKFGGTSVANIDRIRNVARHVKREVDAGHDVAVVVSAMAGKTNELVDWCRDASPMHDAREYDAVVASGEQVTSGLLAIALQQLCEGQEGVWSTTPCVATDWDVKCTQDVFGGVYIQHMLANGICVGGCEEPL